MSAREKLRQRVRALLDKTVGRGCTEAEALAAAELAAKLMRDHGIAPSELEMDRRRSRSASRGRAIKAKLWPVIAWCTNTACIIVEVDGHTAVEFIGREPGPQIAVYLRDVTETALAAGVRRFRDEPFYRRRRSDKMRRQAVAEFTLGFVNRLSRRLEAVFGPQVCAAERAAARRALEAIHPETRPVAPRSASPHFWEARQHGWEAGGKVHLGHGVPGGKAPLAIGRGR